MKKSILLALLLFLGNSGLRAADFWKERDYKQWKPKEAHKMLTKSPWAQTRGGRVEAIAGNPNGSPQRGIPVGLGGADGGDGGGPGFYGGGLAGQSQGAGRLGPPPINVTVRWASALPVKQAIVRSRYRGDFQESEKDKQLLNLKDEQYVVLLTGLPSRMAGTLQRNTDRIKQMTVLHLKKKDPIAAASVEVLPRDQFVEIFLFFPRAEAIALEDKDVELQTQVGPFKIKRKFKLKNMVFKDKLEL